MFELHASMPPMRSAEYQVTIPLKFLLIIHNYTNHQTINQSKSLPGFQLVVTSLDGINSWLIQTLLRGETTRSNRMKFRLMILAFYAGIYGGAHISSVPTNTCVIKNNIPFPSLANHLVPSKFWKVHGDCRVT